MVDSPVFFTHFLHIIRKSIGLLNPVESWQEARGCHGALQSSSDLIFFRKEGRLPVDWAAEKNYFLRVIPTMTFWLVVDLPLWKNTLLRVIPTMTFLRFNIGISSTTSIASAKCGDIFPSSTGTPAQAITKSLSKSIRKCSEGHISVCSEIGPKKR